MRVLLVILGLILSGCSSSNLSKLNDKNSISSGTDLIQTYSVVCSEYKSTNTEFFSCGSGFSNDLDLSKAKAILQAKLNIADVLGSTVIKNEKEQVNESTKDGLNKRYDSNISSQVFETTLNKYQVVWDKSFYENGKYRSFVIIKYIQS
jgi:hypothetical protein